MSHETIGELDQAIAAYTQVMALDRKLGRARLADAYCERAGTHQKDKNDDAAIADYEKSIDFGARDDGCSCDPYNLLIGLYEQDRRYDQGLGSRPQGVEVREMDRARFAEYIAEGIRAQELASCRSAHRSSSDSV